MRRGKGGILMPSSGFYSGFHRRDRMKALEDLDHEERTRGRGLNDAEHAERRAIVAYNLTSCSRLIASGVKLLDEFASCEKSYRDQLEIAARDLWNVAQRIRGTTPA